MAETGRSSTVSFMRQAMSTPTAIGDDRVVGGQHAADGQAVAVVGVGHEGPRHRDGQVAGVAELIDGGGLEVRPPLSPRGRLGPRDVKLPALSITSIQLVRDIRSDLVLSGPIP